MILISSFKIQSFIHFNSVIKGISRFVKTAYPGWIIRIYHDDTIIQETKCKLECLVNHLDGSLIDNVDFCNVGSIPDEVGLKRLNLSRSVADLNASGMIDGMMWRWFPIGDRLVDVFMSRDADSLIIQREVDSVNVWLESSRTGHIMRGFVLNSFLN